MLTHFQNPLIDRTFERRGLQALPLAAPLRMELPEAPKVRIRRDDELDEDAGGTVEPATPTVTPRYDAPEAVRQTMDAISRRG